VPRQYRVRARIIDVEVGAAATEKGGSIVHHNELMPSALRAPHLRRPLT